MGLTRMRPSHEILSGDSADVYFARAESILAQEGLDPLVTMEVFTPRGRRPVRDRRGAQPARPRPGRCRTRRRHSSRRSPTATPSRPRRSSCGSGPAIASSGCTRRPSSGCSPSRPAGRPPPGRASRRPRPIPVISFGARHIHPDITDVLDYAAIVGGCVGASTPAGARLAGPGPDRHDAAFAGPHLRRHGGGGPRVRPPCAGRTCRGSSSSTRSRTRPRRRSGSRTRSATGSTASGWTRRRSAAGSPPTWSTRSVRASTRPASITSRSPCRAASPRTGSAYFKEAGAPVDSYAVGSYISGATPIDFTGDIKEIDGRPIAKRADPGLTDSPPSGRSTSGLPRGIAAGAGVMRGARRAASGGSRAR